MAHMNEQQQQEIARRKQAEERTAELQRTNKLLRTEIAGRKHAGESLRASDAKFRLLFEKSPDAMLLLDGDLFVDCNQAAVDMMGCSSKEELLDLHPYDISPERQPDGRPSIEKARDLIATAFREGSQRFEWVHRAVDGTDFPVEVLLTAIPLSDRGILHVVLRDITEQKRAEEALRESEADLRSLLENAANFVVYRVAVDASDPFGGKVELVSPSIKDIGGISDPYQFESWFENIHPEDLPRVLEANRRAWETGVPYSQPVRVYHSQQQRWIWLHTASTPIFDAEGHLTHFNGLIVDITQQKRAEELLQHQIAFENIITTLSTDFINLSPDEIDNGIDRALRAIGEFTGVDRSYVFRFSEDHKTMDCTHEWCAAGIKSQIQRLKDVPADAWAWSNAIILRGEVLHLPQVADLPPEADAEKHEFQLQGIQSLIVVPMIYQGSVIGFLGFDTVRMEKTWLAESIALLKIVGEIFVNALEHKRADEALRLAFQTLERRVEERTRELSTLLEVSRNMASTLELEPLLGLILDQLKAVVDYSGASVLTLEGDDLIVLAYRGPISQEEALGWRFPLENAPVNREMIRGREPVIIADVQGDAPLERAFRESAGERMETTFSYVRSWVGVPLIVKDRVTGMLGLDHGESDYYSPGHAALALAFANHAAVAIENARLHQAEQNRQRELQTLLDVATAASSSLELDEMLSATLDRLVAPEDVSRAGVMLLNDESGELEPRMIRPEHPVAPESLAEMSQACREVIASGKPLYVPPDAALDHIEPGALLPLRARGQALGVLVIIGPQGSAFSEGPLALFESIADQLGVAVENAGLYEQAEQAAVATERSRLARDLHDAVTQTLFSASLIAEVLPRIWEHNQAEGRRRLEELRELTRGALAEMRTLLLELRPSALIDTELGDLLRQLAESIIGRARLPVTVEVESECAFPPEVKVALYRIAQEALNNVAKHAGAGQASVNLRCISPSPSQGEGLGVRVELRISDDGRGFDSGCVSPESLGLGIMRERAEAIGAVLTVESEVGRGTEVVVIWSVDEGRRTKDKGGRRNAFQV